MGSRSNAKPPIPRNALDSPGAHALSDEVALLQAQLAAAKAELNHQSRLATLGTIAGLIAHEFNNILTPVVSYSQLAVAAPEDAALVRKALTKSLEGSERAARIASAILGLVRDEHSGSRQSGDEHRAPVALALDRALACLAREPARDGIVLSTAVPRETFATISPVALEHILLNLILNARNALVPGGGALRIEARSSDALPDPSAEPSDAPMCSTWSASEPGVRSSGGDRDARRSAEGWITIEIADTGRGMSPQRLERLFEPFLSGDHWNTVNPVQVNTYDDSTAKTGGSGLGMTITRRLVEDAGGEIAVWSAPGRGTRIWVILPASRQNVAQATSSEPLALAAA